MALHSYWLRNRSCIPRVQSNARPIITRRSHRRDADGVFLCWYCSGRLSQHWDVQLRELYVECPNAHEYIVDEFL